MYVFYENWIDRDEDDGYAHGTCSKCKDELATYYLPPWKELAPHIMKEPLLSACCNAEMIDDDYESEQGD